MHIFGFPHTCTVKRLKTRTSSILPLRLNEALLGWERPRCQQSWSLAEPSANLGVKKICYIAVKVRLARNTLNLNSGMAEQALTMYSLTCTFAAKSEGKSEYQILWRRLSTSYTFSIIENFRTLP